MPSASACRSTCAAVSCSMYCAPPSMAACCSSCSLVSASRIGSRLRSSARRCSSPRAQLRCSGRRTGCARRPAPARAAASAPARSAGRPARRRRSSRASSSSICAAACRLVATCAAPCRWRAAARPGARPACAAGTAASCAWRSSAAQLFARGSRARARRRSRHRRVRCGAAAPRPAAGRALRSAPRPGCGAAAGRRARPSTSASSPSSWLRRAWLASACCVRRSNSTCSWCARVCASAASRRVPRQAQRGFGVGRPRRARWRLRASSAISACARMLALEVLDLLLPRQHAGLLGIGRVEAHRVQRHRMALRAT